MTRLTSLTRPSGAVTSSTWQSMHDCGTCQDGGTGLRMTDTDPRGALTTHTYDALGRRTATDGPLELDSTQTWNALGLRVTTQGPAGTSVTHSYDGRALVTQTVATGPNTPTATTYGYDVRGRGTSVAGPLGTGQSFEYGISREVDRVLVNSPFSDTTVYDRNRLGDLTRVIEPWGGQTQWTRDGSGRVTSGTDSSGRTRSYTRDALGRVTAIVATGGGGAPLTSLFTYDANGRRLASALGDTTISRALDGDGALLGRSSTSPDVSETYQRWGGSQVLQGITTPVGQVSVMFDAAEALEGYAFGADVALGWRTTDVAGRPTLEWNPPTMVDMEAYLDQEPPPNPEHLADLPLLGRAVERTWSDGALQGLALRHGSTLVHTRTYTRAPDGRVASFDDSLLGVTTYAYDDAGRLVGATTPEHTWTWTYDTAGNRLTETKDGQTWTTTYAQGNKVLSVAGPDGTVTFTYDAMARVVSRAGTPVGGTWTYAWDPMGRLAEVVRPDGVHVSYRYDTWGERVEKVVGTTVTRYYRSGWFFLELDEDDTVLRTTMFGGDGTTPLWVMQGGTVAYVHHDHLGTPMLLTDTTGAIVWHARFEPWGKADVQIGSFDQPWRFPGQYFDAETGLHYNRQRYYDPALGRYISPDPIGQRGGWNTSAYAANCPSNIVDPTGEFFHPACVLAGPAAPACMAAMSAAQAAMIAAAGLVAMILDSAMSGPCDTGSNKSNHDMCLNHYVACIQSGGVGKGGQHGMTGCEECRKNCTQIGHWPVITLWGLDCRY